MSDLFPLSFDIPSSHLLLTLVDTLGNHSAKIAGLLGQILGSHIVDRGDAHVVKASEVSIAARTSTLVW